MAVDRMATAKAMSWPQLCDGKGTAGAIPKLYHAEGTPLLYMLDRQGRIAFRQNSAKDLDRQLAEVLAKYPRPAWTARDGWQRPAAAMELLGIHEGSTVADVGSGEGYFTFHLSTFVGAKGKVVAVDIDEKALAAIRDRADKEKLPQIETVKGSEDNPRLPASALDAALIVDSYHEFAQPEAMMAAIYGALKPGGKVGIMDRSDELNRRREEYGERHRLPVELVIEEARRQGFRLFSFEPEFSRQPGENRELYLVILEKPK